MGTSIVGPTLRDGRDRRARRHPRRRQSPVVIGPDTSSHLYSSLPLARVCMSTAASFALAHPSSPGPIHNVHAARMSHHIHDEACRSAVLPAPETDRAAARSCLRSVSARMRRLERTHHSCRVVSLSAHVRSVGQTTADGTVVSGAMIDETTVRHRSILRRGGGDTLSSRSDAAPSYELGEHSVDRAGFSGVSNKELDERARPNLVDLRPRSPRRRKRKRRQMNQMANELRRKVPRTLLRAVRGAWRPKCAHPRPMASSLGKLGSSRTESA